MKSEDFMLKEYDKLYELYKIQYEYADKIIQYFLLVVGAFLTIASYIYKDNFGNVDIYNFNSLVLFALYTSTIACSSFYLMLIEHRIKLLLYARSVNGIRKWAVSQNADIKPFLVLPDNLNTPKYFSWFKGFFWELFAFGLLNSIIMGLSLVHIIRLVITVNDEYCTQLYIFIVLVLAGLHLLIYRTRGKQKIMNLKGHSKLNDEEYRYDPPLTPSFHGKDCLGNGTHEGIECCCDECDFYLECFPDWNKS